jgi:transposase
MPPGSPFGPDLTALIVHLHVTQAIGFERLAQLLDEVFGIRISEGAIANLIARAQAPLAASAATIAAEVRASPVVGSDETWLGSRARTGGNGCCCRRPPSTI